MHTMRQVKQRNKQYKPRGPQQWCAFYSTNPANDVADLANDNIEWQLTLNPKYQNNTEHNELDEAKSYRHNDFKGKTRFRRWRWRCFDSTVSCPKTKVSMLSWNLRGKPVWLRQRRGCSAVRSVLHAMQPSTRIHAWCTTCAATSRYCVSGWINSNVICWITMNYLHP